MTAVILELPPKNIKGKRGKITYEINYLRHLKQWTYCIIVPVEPQHFVGDAKSEREANKKVMDILANLVHK